MQPTAQRAKHRKQTSAAMHSLLKLGLAKTTRKTTRMTTTHPRGAAQALYLPMKSSNANGTSMHGNLQRRHSLISLRRMKSRWRPKSNFKTRKTKAMTMTR